MRSSKQTYGQPEKNETRQRVIAHAVTSLSKKRSSSPVVTIREFERTMDYCLRCLEKSGFNIRNAARPHLEDWLSLHHSRVGKKKVEDLNVLFLAGPDPTDDLMAFKKCGVSFHNVWAIEREKAAFAEAVHALRREGLQLKLHNGNLQNFFSIVPQQFDIVYLDLCGPLFGGTPGTIHVLRELLVNQRLAPLSTLITNFCEPVPQSDGVGDLMYIKQWLDRDPSRKLAATAFGSMLTEEQSESVRKWGRLLAVWELACSDSETRSEYLSWFVRSVEADGTSISDEEKLRRCLDSFTDTEIAPNLLQYYSRFVTEFMIRFTAQLLPWWRVAALPGARRDYFTPDEKVLAGAVEASSNAIETWDDVLYPALRHVWGVESFLGSNSPQHEFYFKEALKQIKLGEASG